MRYTLAVCCIQACQACLVCRPTRVCTIRADRATIQPVRLYPRTITVRPCRPTYLCHRTIMAVASFTQQLCPPPILPTLTPIRCLRCRMEAVLVVTSHTSSGSPSYIDKMKSE